MPHRHTPSAPVAADDWRQRMLAHVRALIQRADPEVVEEQKWKKPTNPAGVPVWSHDGILCTGETYRDTVKLTFMRGAALDDPHGLFNASLDGNARRAINIGQADTLDEEAFVALVRTAVALNQRDAGGGVSGRSARRARSG